MSNLILMHGENGKTFFVDKEDYLAHHGILGQKWGQRNGPPYPLSEAKIKSKKNPTTEELKAASRRVDAETAYVEAKIANSNQKHRKVENTISLASSATDNFNKITKDVYDKEDPIRIKASGAQKITKNVSSLHKNVKNLKNDAKKKIINREAKRMTDEELKEKTDHLKADTEYRKSKSKASGREYLREIIEIAGSGAALVGAIKKTKDLFKKKILEASEKEAEKAAENISEDFAKKAAKKAAEEAAEEVVAEIISEDMASEVAEEAVKDISVRALKAPVISLSEKEASYWIEKIAAEEASRRAVGKVGEKIAEAIVDDAVEYAAESTVETMAKNASYQLGTRVIAGLLT